MPDVLVRNIEDDVLKRLKMRAKQNGRSLQMELKLIFQTLVREDENKTLSDEETAAKIKESLRGREFSDSAELLRKDRQRI